MYRANGETNMSFHKIVVALDDSSLSNTVFDRAVALAQATKAQLLLFSGINEDLMVSPTPFPAEMGSLNAGLISSNYQAQQVNFEHHTEALQTVLERYRDAAQAKGVQAETVFQPGDVEKVVCAIAQEWGADLLVVGRRGRKGFSEALLGSVSNYAVHHAHCSVLVVQGDAEAHA
jgi:nucleotide-binding universal stress UspA family protein